MSQPAPKPAAPAKKARVVTLVLRIPTLIGGLLALLVGLVWVFILGILVGRGQAPEAEIPQIAGLMPRVEASAVQPPQIAVPQPAQVIPEEELSYAAALRSQAAGRPRPQASAPAAGEAPKPAARAEQPVQAKPAGEVFDYVYQVAAYKAAAPSDELAAKLKKSGIKAFTEKSTEKGTVWYKTMVSFRGTPDDVDSLRASLLPHKLTRLILKTKKPAPAR